MAATSSSLKNCKNSFLIRREKDCLNHSGSTRLHYHRIVDYDSLKFYHSNSTLSMTSALLLVEVTGYNQETHQMNGHDYTVC